MNFKLYLMGWHNCALWLRNDGIAQWHHNVIKQLLAKKQLPLAGNTASGMCLTCEGKVEWREKSRIVNS